jgi:hypothetical protein
VRLPFIDSGTGEPLEGLRALPGRSLPVSTLEQHNSSFRRRCIRFQRRRFDRDSNVKSGATHGRWNAFSFLSANLRYNEDTRHSSGGVGLVQATKSTCLFSW